MTLNTGILHPGEMGSYLAGAARSNLDKVYWCSEGRSAATHQRAEKQGLTKITTFKEFCEICEIVISVCPPHAAPESGAGYS